jgi:hypothetical protein
VLAIICRLAGFFLDPKLSDDYYRFIWDGMMMHQGVNPMTYVPSYLMTHPELANVDVGLFSMLNSPDYHSVYPPFAQWIYYISYSINNLNYEGHILFYKIILFLADIILFYLLGKLLVKNKLSSDRVLIYALNPLMIIEYTGNLHFESIMICGLLGAVLLSDNRNLIISSLSMMISISSKLVSLILMPFMPKELYWKRILIWSAMTMGSTFVFFWLTFGLYQNWLESVRLWFQTFEFNASIYYIIREIGTLITGYNPIKWIGPGLGFLNLFSIIIIWVYYKRKKEFQWASAMVFVFTIYLFFSTTIHPWYLGTILALSVVSGHMYPMVWTYLVFLSYSHYAGGHSQENYLFIGLEYGLLFLWMFIEYRILRNGRTVWSLQY